MPLLAFSLRYPKCSEDLSAMGMTHPVRLKELAVLTEFLEAGKVVPVINRSYPLSEVAEVFRNERL